MSTGNWREKIMSTSIALIVGAAVVTTPMILSQAKAGGFSGPGNLGDKPGSSSGGHGPGDKKGPNGGNGGIGGSGSGGIDGGNFGAGDNAQQISATTPTVTQCITTTSTVGAVSVVIDGVARLYRCDVNPSRN